MKTRTNLHAGADDLQTCKQQKEYWIDQYDHMQNVLASCQPYNPPYYPPYNPPSPQQPTNNGGWVGGTYYPDKSGLCG